MTWQLSFFISIGKKSRQLLAIENASPVGLSNSAERWQVNAGIILGLSRPLGTSISSAGAIRLRAQEVKSFSVLRQTSAKNLSGRENNNISVLALSQMVYELHQKDIAITKMGNGRS